jgi:hypothetical protein
MTAPRCFFCDMDTLAEVLYSMPVADGLRTVQVDGLCMLRCSHCGGKFIPTAMYMRNRQLVKEALAKKPE